MFETPIHQKLTFSFSVVKSLYFQDFLRLIKPSRIPWEQSIDRFVKKSSILKNSQVLVGKNSIYMY